MRRSFLFCIFYSLVIFLIFNLVRASNDDAHFFNTAKTKIESLIGIKSTNQKNQSHPQITVLNESIKPIITATNNQDITRYIGRFYKLKFETSPGQLLSNAFHDFLNDKNRFNISHRFSDEIYLIYTDYSQYGSNQLTIFIGYSVSSFSTVSHQYERLVVPNQTYATIEVTGNTAFAMNETWMNLDTSNFTRTFMYDMEVYPIDSQLNTVATSYIKVSIKNED